MALDESGKPSFNTLRNYGLSTAPVFYFDVLMLVGRDVAKESLIVRRKLLENRILSKLADHIRHEPELRASVSDLIHSVKAQGLEGLAANRRNTGVEGRDLQELPDVGQSALCFFAV